MTLCPHDSNPNSNYSTFVVCSFFFIIKLIHYRPALKTTKSDQTNVNNPKSQRKLPTH